MKVLWWGTAMLGMTAEEDVAVSEPVRTCIGGALGAADLHKTRT